MGQTKYMLKAVLINDESKETLTTKLKQLVYEVFNTK